MILYKWLRYVINVQTLRFKPPSHHEIGDSDSRGDFTGVGSTLLISKNYSTMIINIILWILMVLAIIGFLNSVRIEWTEKRNSSEFAVKWLMKKLSKEGATNIIHANETGITFVGNDTFYYLDWHQEPVTTLYAVYQLDECVDLEKARAVAFMLSSSCEALSIQIKDSGEIILGCTTIIPDAKSLWAVTPYMLGFLDKALELFTRQYEKDNDSKEESN